MFVEIYSSFRMLQTQGRHISFSNVSEAGVTNIRPIDLLDAFAQALAEYFGENNLLGVKVGEI